MMHVLQAATSRCFLSAASRLALARQEDAWYVKAGHVVCSASQHGAACQHSKILAGTESGKFVYTAHDKLDCT